MGDGISMSISVDSPSDETLNRGPLAPRRQYEFPFGINTVQFSFFFFQFFFFFHSYYSSKQGEVDRSKDSRRDPIVGDL